MEGLGLSMGCGQEIMGSFFRNRKVFITGHTGFKGAWLCLILKSLGADVCGYALDPPTRPSLFDLVDAGKDVASIHGDVRDLDRLAKGMKEFGPEVVIHLAAQSLVRQSYRDPVGTYGTNVMGTVNLLEAVRRSDSVRAVVVVTSDKCYENREWVRGYRESDAMGGHDPYSSSKGCAELVTAAYLRSYFPEDRYGEHGVAIASARAGNVIGGGDFAEDRIVPDMVRACLGNRPVRIRYPRATRPWEHVLEPLAGYLILAERLYAGGTAFGGAWNFGPLETGVREVGWLVERFISLWGPGASWEYDKDTHPQEASLLKLDCSKARSGLGWMPCLNLDEALRWTVEWYGFFRDDPSSLRTTTEAQIRAYGELSCRRGDAS